MYLGDLKEARSEVRQECEKASARGLFRTFRLASENGQTAKGMVSFGSSVKQNEEEQT